MTLRATDVSHSYGTGQVLRDLSIRVEPGEVVAIIGPSGVGKTTLLRLLALSLEPDRGRIELDGTDVWAVDEADRLSARRRVGMVFQEASLFDTSVARNVGYGLRIRRSWSDRLRDEVRSLAVSNRIVGTARGILDFVGLADRLPEDPPASIGPDSAVREALEVVGLADRMAQHVDTLSGGEAQRVSFARALAYDPDVLLLDEPTSDLDPRNTAVIEEAIAEARARGLGIIVATHDMHQAARVADRVAVLLGDSITETGPTEAVFEAPENERTRKFISGELVY